MPRRAYLSTPEEDSQPETFKRTRTERGKEWEETEKGLTKTMGTEHALFAKEQNRGTNGSPGRPENSTIKGGDELWRKQREKKKETQERRNSPGKNYQKNREWRENTKGKTNIASRYPVKATIAHTRIQRESNFASIEGWNSHSRLQFLSLIEPCITS